MPNTEVVTAVCGGVCKKKDAWADAEDDEDEEEVFDMGSFTAKGGDTKPGSVLKVKGDAGCLSSQAAEFFPSWLCMDAPAPSLGAQLDCLIQNLVAQIPCANSSQEFPTDKPIHNNYEMEKIIADLTERGGRSNPSRCFHPKHLTSNECSGEEEC